MTSKRNLPEAIKHLVVVFFLICTMAPFAVMVFKSFKNAEQNLYAPFSLSLPLHFDNYAYAFAGVGPYIMNTVIITTAGTLLIIILSAMGAFVFARYNFPGKGFFYMAVIALMMVPGVLTLVPLFLLSEKFGILNTKLAIILPGLRAQIPMAVFLTRAFMEGISKEMFEAAALDGAGMGRSFLNIALPLVKPILATVAILCILFFWNDIIWPSIALQTADQYTLAIGLKPFTAKIMEVTKNLGPVMAGYCIVSVPLLLAFFAASKQFIAGLASGSVKM
ncbi:MAG: carbohydrate ABC transporter permease [Treponema sp.]|jgi:ABC-type glycerol-3-phosphate transport system permease component|nr:carbohydrate ABC transporter permease [Treponema sp.]